jgi:hypothetical protein
VAESMKPKNWEQLDPLSKAQIAKELFHSERGKYIISQALYKAMTVMKEVDDSSKEVSNIQDMEILYETIFHQFP